MPAVYPRIWNRQYPLVQNVPQVLDPQVDSGFVATYWEIWNFGGKVVYATILGQQWAIPGSVGLKFPGPIANVTVVCTDVAGSIVQAYASENQGQLPQLDIAGAGGGGGGGGGSGPSANLEYLVYSTTVAPSAPNMIPMKLLPGDLEFTRDESTSFAGHVSVPVSLAADFGGGTTVVAGGGIGQIWSVRDAGGNSTYGAQEWRLLATGTEVGLYFKQKLGADMAHLFPGIPGQRNGLHFTGSNAPRAVLAEDGAELRLGTVSGAGVYIDVGAVAVVEVTSTGVKVNNPGLNSQIVANGSLLIEPGLFGDLTLAGSAGASELKLNAAIDGAVLQDPTKVTIRPAAYVDATKDWVFKSTGELHAPGVTAAEIKNLAAGTSSDAAATVGQLTTATVTFGAISTGTIADAPFLKLGSAYAAADLALSATDVWSVPAPTQVFCGTLVCDTGPAGHDQDFLVYKNGVYTGFHCLLALGDNIGVFGGTGFNCAATDNITVKAVNSGDPADVGALGVVVTLGHRGF